MNSKKLFKVAPKSVVEVVSRDKDYCLIKVNEKEVGWVYCKFVNLN